MSCFLNVEKNNTCVQSSGLFFLLLHKLLFDNCQTVLQKSLVYISIYMEGKLWVLFKFFSLSLSDYLGLDMMILRTGVSEISEESSDLIQGFNEVCNDLSSGMSWSLETISVLNLRELYAIELCKCAEAALPIRFVKAFQWSCMILSPKKWLDKN